ncbi:MAG: DUF2007 domain-containing protein, partial [Limisphaerales bacterium]
MELVTVLDTADQVFAELIKSRLEAAGIHCVITAESNPLPIPSRIRVNQADEEAARAIINEDLSDSTPNSES